jgi:nicotinamide mononucleotide transporter
MITAPEVLANVFNAASIVLAGRNSAHTWWTGIIGCILFGWVFFGAKLYADTTLQVFFVITSVLGWLNWQNPRRQSELPIRNVKPRTLFVMLLVGVLVAASYAWLLHRFTDAYAPVLDSIVLVFSVIAQLLLMARRLETWWFWLLVNSIAVPLFATRGLFLTAVLYTGFWFNALVSLRHWRQLSKA